MDEDAQNRKKLLTQYTNEVSVNIDTKKKKIKLEIQKLRTGQTTWKCEMPADWNQGRKWKKTNISKLKTNSKSQENETEG